MNLLIISQSSNVFKYISASALLLANIWLVWLVWQTRISFGDILLIFWLETAIVCVFAGIKYLTSSILSHTGWKKLGAVLWSAVVLSFFGFIAFLGLMFVLGLITYYVPEGQQKSISELLNGEVRTAGWFFVASHGISFVLNFLGRKEYLKWIPQQQRSVYDIKTDIISLVQTRLMVVFVSCFGGWGLWVLIDAFFHLNENDLPLLVTAFTFSVFIGIKVLLDLRTHLQEHN